MSRLRTHPRAVAGGAAIALIVVALAIGLAQGGGERREPADVPTLAEARAEVASARGPLARLYEPAAATRGVRVLRHDRAGFRALLRGLRGRPVLVNVWYPSCGPCRREFPILRRAAATYGTRVAFLGVVTRDPVADVQQFLRDQPTVYPHVRDPDERIARAELQAGLAYPSTVLIDAGGRITGVKAGEYPSLAALEDDLRAKLGISRSDPAGRSAR